MANYLMSNCLAWAKLLIPINSVVGVGIVVIFGVLCFSHKHFFHRMKLKRPPGPFPIWPILGSLPLLGKFPYFSLYNLSKKYGDVMELKLGTTNIVVISSPKLAKEVLQTHDLVFATRSENVVATMFSYGRKDVAWAPYGHDWRQMRKLCTLGLFTPKRLHASKKVRNEEISCMVHEIFEHCKEGKLVNLKTMLTNTSLNMMTRLLFNKKYFSTKQFSTKECEEFNDFLTEELHLQGLFNVSDYVSFLKPFDLQGFLPRGKKIHMKMDRFFDKILHDHRIDQKENVESKDFVDMLLSSSRVDNYNYTLDNNTIKGIINDMLIAGTDTTSTTIEWALAELVKNPNIMKKTQDELDHVVGHHRIVDEDDIPQLKYLQAVVKETFRLHATVPLITRECMTNCKVGGYDILAKTPIIVNIWAIHRHSSTYDNPWDFNPERFVGSGVDVKGVDFELLPFGSGRRVCLGMPLGLMQVQYELARLLHSFTWKLPIGENPQNMDMGEVFGVTLPKVIPLEVIPIARLPLHMYGPL